jgi:ribosomal protein S20
MPFIILPRNEKRQRFGTAIEDLCAVLRGILPHTRSLPTQGGKVCLGSSPAPDSLLQAKACAGAWRVSIRQCTCKLRPGEGFACISDYSGEEDLGRRALVSISPIMSSAFNYQNQSVQSNLQPFKKEFQQLGEDLQAGNMVAAQSDFATLQKLGPQGVSTASGPNSSALAKAMQQLSQDLQSGNLSAAQQDYAAVQQDVQQHAVHMHHHHRAGASEISQMFHQSDEDLQAGDITSAQQAYASLQQELRQIGAAGQNSASTGSTVSVSA